MVRKLAVIVLAATLLSACGSSTQPQAGSSDGAPNSPSVPTGSIDPIDDPATVPAVLGAMDQIWANLGPDGQRDACAGDWKQSEVPEFTQTMFGTENEEIVTAVRDWMTQKCGWTSG
ncbi:MAG: hypothetical protein Q4G67_01645 [Actinomycetia bacterium]|nr:hypothetical protein [Actinomycetes bacterium]